MRIEVQLFYFEIMSFGFSYCLILIIVRNIIVDGIESVEPTNCTNIVCLDYSGRYFRRCISSVESSRTMVGKVVSSSGFEIDLREVILLSIQTNSEVVKFVPTGIKKKFPMLREFRIIRSGLTHLERDDMRQFGDELIDVSFKQNLLTSLESELFLFNPNLINICLSNNPIKFIDGRLVRNFENMHLKKLEILSSNCVHMLSILPRREDWYLIEDCNDRLSEYKSKKIMRSRVDFFNNGYVHRCNCGDTFCSRFGFDSGK